MYGERLGVDQLKGRNVIDNQGTQVGEVEDVSIDPAGWRVTGLVVNVRKEVADDLHLDRPLMGKAHVEFAVERIQAMGENVILNLNTDEIAGALRGAGYR